MEYLWNIFTTCWHLLQATSKELGDELCRLVNQCAAWLRTPVFKQGTEATSDRSTRDFGVSLQPRIRKLLILALAHLDLQDHETRESLQPSLSYIGGLLEKVDWCANAASKAKAQWQELQSLLGQGIRESFERVPAEAKLLPRNEMRKRRLEFSKQASSLHGVFRPNAIVRNLPEVFSDQDREVRLKCAHCDDHLIVSAWFWRHPRTRKIHVLVPHRGHFKCRSGQGTRACKSPWVALEDFPIAKDQQDHLEFCPHNMRKTRCVLCGGRDICCHQRRRDSCRLCKGRCPKRQGEMELRS